MKTFESSSEQIGRNDHASIDVENPYSPLVNSVRRELETLTPLSYQCCIYRVPRRLHQQDEVYTPQVVSIGPFHHDREELKAMEEQKRRYLNDFLQRTTVSLDDFVKLIKEKEAILRNCYAESIGLNSDDFVKIILMDAVFIIEVLMRDNFPELTRNDGIYAKPWMTLDICLDMCLLENQLPFFILEDVLRLANIAISFSLVKLAQNCFKHYGFCVTEDLLWNNSSPTVEHFVDLLRICHLPSTLRPREFKTLNMPTITELHQAGVKFKLASSKNLFDIQLNNGILEIPKLRIQDQTKLILKNLLVFERCHCNDNYISDYVCFINYLVNAPKDVELLVQNGIMDNWMDKSEEVSTLFQNLWKNVFVCAHEFYFNALIEDLNVYYRSPWPKWKASLKQDYFNTPWTTISVIVAVLFLILTFIQTVCSIISVAAPGRT